MCYKGSYINRSTRPGSCEINGEVGVKWKYSVFDDES